MPKSCEPFRSFWTEESHVQIQAGSIGLLKISLQYSGAILLHLVSLRDKCFEKEKLSIIRRKINGQSSLLVSTMKGLTAVF